MVVFANRIFSHALIVPPTIAVKRRTTCRIIYRNIIYMTNTFSTCSITPMPRITALRSFFAGIHKARSQRVGTDYTELCATTGMLSLEERRVIAAFLFGKGLLRNSIDCPKLLEQLSINVPSRAPRTYTPCYLPLARSNFEQSAPIYRIAQICDFFLNNAESLDLLGFNQPITTSALASILLSMRQ
ncbi:hypothetical protein KQX54_004010 [Cotesia glomerata]|uniref:Uncharacterized protein n=1 Tax=Cotesia glomerata TaxID=32391 RepID=A0AAV7HQZ7_COTGL|nr:hypothetical protein KQX54_004010 [Cotesia glomerata]